MLSSQPSSELWFWGWQLFETQRVASHAGDLPKSHSFLTLAATGVTLEAVKRAEDTDALVVRLVERCGGQEDVHIVVDLPVAAAADCDLLENELQPVPVEDRSRVRLSMRPYEIRTIKLTK